MKTWVRKTLSVGILAAGALLFAPGAANADTHQVTGENNGILNGTQIAIPIRVPVNFVGNSLGILGEANAQGIGVNRTESAHDVQATGANNGILNGTQVLVPISVPINAVGNSVAVLGEANAAGVGANNVSGRRAESAHTTEGFWPGSTAQVTGANNGILNGTQIAVPISVPINVCGNSLALLGEANSRALCANNVLVHRGKRRESGHVTEGGPDFLQATGSNNGILNGTQIGVPISVPINVCGNSLGILGEANSAALCANNVGDDDWGWDGDHRHGHGGHGHGGHGNGHGHGNGQNAGDHGQNAGDNGDDDGSYLGDNGSQGNGNGDADGGYGHGTQPAGNGYGHGTQPASNGYGQDVSPAAAGSGSDATGGREALPVSGLTETVGDGGLGLLNTLR